jgi:Recombination endonuclease VII
VKRCNRCGETKPLDDFYGSKLGRDGVRPECRACNLAARKAKYAANPQPYIARVKKWQQENAGRLNAYRREYNQHATGLIRGLLCFRCNQAIGSLQEDHDIFQAAADYLDRDDELAGLVRARVGALGA